MINKKIGQNAKIYRIKGINDPKSESLFDDKESKIDVIENAINMTIL